MRGKDEEAGRDTCTADVVALRVFVPPKPTCITSKKRNALAKIDPMETKKSRAARNGHCMFKAILRQAWKLSINKILGNIL